jgi:hypothetical protein
MTGKSAKQKKCQAKGIGEIGEISAMQEVILD